MPVFSSKDGHSCPSSARLRKCPSTDAQEARLSCLSKNAVLAFFNLAQAQNRVLRGSQINDLRR